MITFEYDDRRARAKLESVKRIADDLDDAIRVETRWLLVRIRGVWPRASGRSAAGFRVDRRRALEFFLRNPVPHAVHVRRTRNAGEPTVLEAEVVPLLEEMKRRIVARIQRRVRDIDRGVNLRHKV